MKPFSHYKNSIDSILENSFNNTTKFKKNLSVVMGAMKYSKTLREFFTLYNDIETKKFKSQEERKDYINESTNYLKNNKNNLSEVTSILDKIIKDRVELCEERTNKIYENIDNIVFNNNVINFGSITESKKYLTENFIDGTKETITEIKNPKILSHVISKNYSEAYDGVLSEQEKNILKNTLLMSEDTLIKEFNNVKEVVLSKLNTLISESKNEELSATLVKTKNEISTLDTTKNAYIRVRGLLEDLN
jgi:hypothetical protein